MPIDCRVNGTIAGFQNPPKTPGNGHVARPRRKTLAGPSHCFTAMFHG
jgi:hypothetical protein